MPRILGIDFAPLSRPWENRLETFFVTLHLLNFSLHPTVVIFCSIYLLSTKYYFIALGYMVYVAIDFFILETHAKGGRRINAVRTCPPARYTRDFFPITLEKTVDLPTKENYIIGSHPHGVIGYGAVINFGTDTTGFGEMFKGIKAHLLTISNVFLLPITRWLFMALGGCSVSKDSIRHILLEQGTGNAAIIVIGGAAEALEAKPGNYKITLLNRKGFVRMALETGAHLVPSFSFGENDLYYQAPNPQGSALRNFQEYTKNKLGFTLPIVYGRGIFNYTFGMLPHRRPIHTIVGAPIFVPKCPKPPVKMVDEYHKLYMDALAKLFDEHKSKFSIDKDVQLEYQ